MSNRTAQLSIRLHPPTRAAFGEAVEKCGMDPSAGARLVVELLVKRLERGGDFLDAVQEMRVAWQMQERANDVAR